MLLPVVCKLLVAAWLVYVACYDWRTWRVPCWTTWPVILAACLAYAWRGAWGPLALYATCFVWDTTRGDARRLLRRQVGAHDDEQWLLPDPVAGTLTVLLLLAARGQGPEAFMFTLGSALVHGLWRLGRLPGGDAALLLALLAFFPRLDFLLLAAVVVTLVVLPQLAWRYRHDLLTAVRRGPRAGLATLVAAVPAKAQPEPVAYLFALAGLAGLVWL